MNATLKSRHRRTGSAINPLYARSDSQIAEELYRRTGERITAQYVGKIARRAADKIRQALAGSLWGGMTKTKHKKRYRYRYGRDYRPHLGKPLERAPTPKDLDRFLSYIEYTKDGHWLWRGYCDKKGYGQFHFDGRKHWAHRWARQVFHGNLEPGQQAAHDDECRNPSCVSPWHIHAESHEKNTADGNRDRDDSFEPPF